MLLIPSLVHHEVKRKGVLLKVRVVTYRTFLGTSAVISAKGVSEIRREAEFIQFITGNTPTPSPRYNVTSGKSQVAWPCSDDHPAILPDRDG